MKKLLSSLLKINLVLVFLCVSIFTLGVSPNSVNAASMQEIDSIDSMLENRFADDFFECGLSGIHTRQTVIDSLSKITANREIFLSDFSVKWLSDTVVLARYKASIKEVGRESFHSSIWINIDNDWKIFYHQSTLHPIK